MAADEQVQEQAQWIGGAWGPAAGGASFELRSLSAPYGARGRWPRAGEPDLRAAREAAQAARPAWEPLGRARRLEVCQGALERLEQRAFGGDLPALLAPALGVTPELVGELLAEELLRAREALELARDGGAERPEWVLFAAHWSDRVGLLFARLVGRLAGGARLLLLGDARLPEAAQALAEAFAGAGLPAGVLALLFDDGRTLLRAARAAGDFDVLRECSHPELPEPAAEGPPGFGAGLQGHSTWPLARAVHCVARADDVAGAAEEVLERALGPCRTLYGQLPGSVGVVLCHQRSFAALSAELLARLDQRPDWTAARAPLDGELPGWLGEAWSLALDEGAAPLAGEPPDQLRDLPRAPSDDTQRRPPRAIQPLLFTNVEPGGRLVALARPAPLLRLVRMTTDAEARDLALRLTAR